MANQWRMAANQCMSMSSGGQPQCHREESIHQLMAMANLFNENG